MSVRKIRGRCVSKNSFMNYPSVKGIFMTKLWCLFLIQAGFSLPINPQILQGDATINARADCTEIFAGEYAHLQWDSFNIDPNECVRFLQHDNHSIAVNQVVSATPSMLFGRLEANGKIVLINQSGILVGKEALINTGSFIASTLDLVDLSAKRFRFAKNRDSSFVHQGSICSEEVFILGGKVDIQGSIAASDGIHISSGSKVCLENSKFLFDDRSSSESIEVTGVLSSPKIFLETPASAISIGGNLIARDSGEIRILGAFNIIHPETRIDVSGINGGGTVLIGGDYKGENPSIVNSQQTWVKENTFIFANAIESGDGGKVILWGNSMTYFDGTIEAKGGSLSGNGGFVEISSKEGLFPKGQVDTTAPFGKTGMLFFDPCTVTISSDPTTFGVTPGSMIPLCPLITPQNYQFGAFAAANINIADLTGYISCNNVTIDASASGGGAIGSITLTAAADTPAGSALTWNSLGAGPDPTKLTLIADGFIDIRNVITSSTPSASSATPVIEISAPDVTIGDPGLGLGNGASLNSVSGRIIVNAPTSLSIYSAAAVADAGIVAGSGGTGSVQINCGTLLLQSGSANTVISAPDVSVQANSDINMNGGTIASLIPTRALITTTGGNIFVRGARDCNIRGGSGTINSSAGIDAVGGNIFCQIAGDYLLAGGTNTVGSSIAAIGLEGAAGSIRVEGANFTLLGGTAGAGMGFNFPYIGALVGGNGPITVIATGGTGIVLTPQFGHSAFISTSFDVGNPATGGDITINTTNLMLNGSTIFGPQFSAAIVSARGNVEINASSEIHVIGGNTTPPGSAFISADTAGTSVVIRANTLQMQGGASPSSHAIIGAAFGPVTVELVQNCQMLGGAGAGALTSIGSAITGGTGDLSITAANFILMGGSGAGAQTFISAGDPLGITGSGNVFINAAQNISLTGGAGVGSSALIATGGTANLLSIQGLGNLNLTSSSTSSAAITTRGGPISISMGNNLNMLSAPGVAANISIGAGGNSDLTIRVGNSAFVNSTIQNLGAGNLIISVDENFPSPYLGSGAFYLGAGASLTTTSGAIRIFTSQQQLNSILGLLNGLSFRQGSLFVDTNQEIWCVYFPSNLAGNPFTIFYKECLQLLASQAQIIANEALADFHPANEFPGWWKRFVLSYEESFALAPTPYFITVRQQGVFWTPKTYTSVLHEENFD